MKKLVIAAAIALCGVLATAPIAHAGINGDSRGDRGADRPVRDSILMSATEQREQAEAGDAPPATRYRRVTMGWCVAANSRMPAAWIQTFCTGNHPVVRIDMECGADEVQADSLWRQEWNADENAWGHWTWVNEGACLGAADLADEARRAFKELTLDPSPLHIQPDQDWTLINVHTVTYTDAEPQSFDIELLDIPVTVRAVPDSYSWDYGDGSAPLVTDDTGRAWSKGDHVPDDSWVGHTYSEPGTATVTLTTTWRGEFQLRGASGWEQIAGELTTSSSSDPITVHEARTGLVEDPLTAG